MPGVGAGAGGRGAIAPHAGAAGDVVLTSAPATSTRAARALVEGSGVKLEEGVPLARLTTLGTGPGAVVRAAGDARGARGGARLGGGARAACRRVGLGSNLLVADEGVDALVAQARGRARAVEVDDERARRGRRRAERGLPPPRARRGARRVRVRVRDPRHGRRRRLDERGRLRARLVARSSSARSSSTADGAGWLTPDELGLRYRHSELRHGQVVARVEFRLDAASRPTRSRRRSPSSGAAEGDAADEQAHVRERVQEPGHELGAGRMLEALRARRVPRSAARRSRPSTRTSSRTPAARRPRTRSR